MASTGRPYTKVEDLVARPMAGDTIIIPVRGRVVELDSIFTLNDVASAVWNLIDGQRDLGQIARLISDEYEVSLTEAHRDVLELIASLEEAGLIRLAAESGGRA